MSLHAAARRRLGELLGGDEGKALITQAGALMSAQGIKRPDRWTAMFAPGFPEGPPCHQTTTLTPSACATVACRRSRFNKANPPALSQSDESAIVEGKIARASHPKCLQTRGLLADPPTMIWS